MKLISFDIGIRNMAYCIFDTSNQSLIVQDWNILNLMDIENTVLQTCNCHLGAKPKKSSKKSSREMPASENIAATLCGKRAKYRKNGDTFCEMHAKKSVLSLGHIIPAKDISPAALKKMSREDLIILGTIKYNIFTPENLATMCKTKKACLDILLTYFQEHCFEPILAKKVKGAGEIDLITIGRNMRDRLDELVGVNDITHVIMENQISPLAGRMKTVQGMLTQYYIMREIMNNNRTSVKIEYISSANKLKNLVIPDPLNENITVQDKYKKHKEDSIKICSQFLSENPQINGQLNTTSWTMDASKSKRDDLADCFLQGIWYLKREKIITYAYNLKINIV